MDRALALEKAREVLDIEIAGIAQIRDSLGDSFLELVETIIDLINNGGKIVVTGVGKSGHIGKKIAASLASTGSIAIFLHPVEAMHGDLGMIQEGDLLLALSYSGETDELLHVILPAKRLGVKIASFSGNAESSLAKLSDIAVVAPVPREACPFNLAPTTSSTAHLALGDALAVTLMQLRHFTKSDYGRLHPSGAIGRAVTMKVSDVMRDSDRMAKVMADATVAETLVKMTEARCGSAIIADAENNLLGIFTDGDFRRIAQTPGIFEKKIGEVMVKNPISIRFDAFAVEILKVVENKAIDDLPVVDAAGKVVGLVDIQDLPGLKLM